jgi:hypothetical protein
MPLYAQDPTFEKNISMEHAMDAILAFLALE